MIQHGESQRLNESRRPVNTRPAIEVAAKCHNGLFSHFVADIALKRGWFIVLCALLLRIQLSECPAGGRLLLCLGLERLQQLLGSSHLLSHSVVCMCGRT